VATLAAMTTTALPAAVAARDDDGPRRRWRVWRSPAGQPRWARPALLALAALAAVVYGWNIGHAGYAPLYSQAVKSMSVSWKAFCYGALDPGATITIDKLAGSFLPQALSARIFGYHQWSLALPQVIEGVIATLVMYRVVRRWSGEVAGLLAAGLLALTPVVTSMFGHGMEDGALTMCLVLAADAYQRAVNHARLRSLLLAGGWVGIGFQCKMLQAWMIVPALAIGYLVLAPTSWKRRLVHLLAAGAVLLGVSVSWIMLYTVTPAADRPYVDATSNNSAWSMVFAYNGLSRFGITGLPGTIQPRGGSGGTREVVVQGQRGPSKLHVEGAPPKGSGAQLPPKGEKRLTGSGMSGPAGGGYTKLLETRATTQIGWLYPVALAGLALGLWWPRRSPRTDRLRGGYLMWGIWLATVAALFSDMGLPHTAYLATLAIPIAALAGAGTVLLVRAYRDGGPRAWALPAVVAAGTAWAVYLAWPYPDFLPWLIPLVAIAGGTATTALVLHNLARRHYDTPVRSRWVLVAVVLGVVAVVAAPVAWGVSVLDREYGGSAFDATAGPNGSDQVPGDTGNTLSARQRQLLAYVRAHGHGARYAFAVNRWEDASWYIGGAGARVLPMGGFAGSVPQPTLARVRQLVAAGQLRFFLLRDADHIGVPGGSGGTQVGAITKWVASTCHAVPAGSYGGAQRGSDGTALTLYDCG
jgi:4-amino-4-deoxy-L-arabinose transferase-like glycosyltransferase